MSKIQEQLNQLNERAKQRKKTRSERIKRNYKALKDAGFDSDFCAVTAQRSKDFIDKLIKEKLGKDNG